MSDFVKALPIVEGHRVVKVEAIGDYHYFSTNQHNLSYLLCVELYDKINDISGEDLTMFARNSIEVIIEDNELSAAIMVKCDPVNYRVILI